MLHSGIVFPTNAETGSVHFFNGYQSIKEIPAYLPPPDLPIKEKSQEEQDPLESMAGLFITPKRKANKINRIPDLVTLEDTVLKPQPTIQYHQRVLRWFSSDPKENPLENDPKYCRQHLSAEARAWILLEHAYAIEVDQFVHREGIRQGTSVALVGEISIHGETRKGLFTYGFTEDGICYHRWFSTRSENQLFEEYAKKGFYELDFPPFEMPANKRRCQLVASLPLKPGQVVINKTKYVITIQNLVDGSQIRFCRLGQNVI